MSDNPSNYKDPRFASSVNRYLRLIDQLDTEHISAGFEGRARTEANTVATTPSIDINNEIAREQKLKNDNVEQDIQLKRMTLNRLFVFLAAETILIFAFTFFQAVHWPFSFHLEEWSFKLVLTATILQITGMLYVAVRYLFPKAK